MNKSEKRYLIFIRSKIKLNNLGTPCLAMEIFGQEVKSEDPEKVAMDIEKQYQNDKLFKFIPPLEEQLESFKAK